MDELSFTLSSPITEEEWDMIADVDFEHTENIWFHTKHGKDVEFVKRKKGKWTLHPDGTGTCDQCGVRQVAIWDFDKQQSFCGHCGADMRVEHDD